MNNKNIVIAIVGLAGLLILILLITMIFFPKNQNSGSNQTTFPSPTTIATAGNNTNNGITPKPNGKEPKDTIPSGAAQEAINYQKTQHPDIFLASQTPYSTKDFSVLSQFKQQTAGHFAFTVLLKTTDKNVAKNEFISWVKTFSITDQQIQTLDIEYR